jgi:hypothetical protein
MFQRAVQLPGLSAQQKFMISKVLEARLVQRHSGRPRTPLHRG